MYGVWNLADFVASTYGIAPPLTIGHDGDLELPCTDALWRAQSAQEWVQARDAENGSGSGPATVRDAFALLANEQNPPSTTSLTMLRWSPFAVVVIMHILATRLWHLNQGGVPWRSLSEVNHIHPNGSSGPDTSRIPKLFMTAIGRCHDLIRAYEDHVERSIGSQHANHARLQLSNAAEVLRVCYGRTVPALTNLDCDSLLRGGLGDVLIAIQEYVFMPLERNAEVTLAAFRAYEGLCVPLRHGTQFFRKTGALTGSLEHIIAGWDNGKSKPPEDVEAQTP